QSTSVAYADGDHLRLTIPEARSPTAVILDARNKTIVEIFDDQKTYASISEDTLGGTAEDEWTFESLGTKRVVNGIPCEAQRIRVHGAVRYEACTLAWSSSLVEKRDFVGLAKLSRLSGSLFMQRLRYDEVPPFGHFPGLPVALLPIAANGSRG